MSKEQIMKNAMDEFRKIQKYMLLARKEKSMELPKASRVIHDRRLAFAS